MDLKNNANIFFDHTTRHKIISLSSSDDESEGRSEILNDLTPTDKPSDLLPIRKRSKEEQDAFAQSKLQEYQMIRLLGSGAYA
jgi:hypothetical protein